MALSVLLILIWVWVSPKKWREKEKNTKTRKNLKFIVKENPKVLYSLLDDLIIIIKSDKFILLENITKLYVRGLVREGARGVVAHPNFLDLLDKISKKKIPFSLPLIGKKKNLLP